MKKEQEVGDLIEIIRKLGKQLVIKVKPKNIYSNSDDIGEEFKSVTFLLFSNTLLKHLKIQM